MEIQNFLYQIFGENYKSYIETKLPTKSSYSDQLLDLEQWIDTFCKNVGDYANEEKHEKDNRNGRIGFRKVRLRVKLPYGVVTMNDTRTSVICQSDIATVCGDCFVCAGKWMYEVQLKSGGSMRLGWLKHGQKLNRDRGVGDVFGSYGYDGHYKRLVTSGKIQAYGGTWYTGDVVGVLIDFERQVIDYYVNGRSLGSVNIDDTQFLCPAVTLTKAESVHMNFGQEPFCYPIDDYEPLERVTASRVGQAQHFLQWLSNLFQIIDDEQQIDLKRILNNDINLGQLINEIFKIFEIFFSDLIDCTYIIVNNILPFMFNLMEKSTGQLMILLNFLWDFCPTTTLTSILKQIFEQAKLTIRRAATNLNYTEQKNMLKLLHEILTHRPTRLFAIKYIYFDRCDFGFFFHIKPLGDYWMKREVPDVWWTKKDVWMEKKRKAYENHGKRIYESLLEIEKLQNRILSLFMLNDDSDNDMETSTRTLFLTELRDFAVMQKFSVHLGLNMDMPPPAALTTFFKLLIIFDNLTYGRPLTDIMPEHVFYNGSVPYEFCDRLGGSEGYLKTTLNREIVAVLGDTTISSPQSSSRNREKSISTQFDGIISIKEPTVTDGVNMGSKISFQLETEREHNITIDEPISSAVVNDEYAHDSTARFVSQLPFTISENTTSTTAIDTLSLRSEQDEQQSQQNPPVNLLTPIAEDVETGSMQIINILSSPSEQEQESQQNPATNQLSPNDENVEDELTQQSQSLDRVLSFDPVINSSVTTFAIGPNIHHHHNHHHAGNLIVLALKEMSSARKMPEENLIDEILKIPKNRNSGIINEKTSYTELLDMILFIFITLAKRQVQKIAEIYARFESHEKSWNDLKIQEKILNKSIVPKVEQSSIQFDPFDIHYFSDELLTISDNNPNAKTLNKSNLLSMEMCRYETKSKYGPHVAVEIIQHAIDGHEKILNELSRDKLWVRNVILTNDRVIKLFHLLERLCEILLREARSNGQLFTFVPDFYIFAVESLVTALYIHLPIIYDLEKEFSSVSCNTLKIVVNLVVELIGDDRLVKEDCRDALEKILASLVYTKYTIKALEKLPFNLQEKLILYLINSYNVKRNVGANWILLRIWHGNGFAFQYNQIPNTYPSNNKWMYINITYSLTNLHPPNPSSILQQSFLRTLHENNAEAVTFFNNILNKINWACSEFLNMLQEVKQVVIAKESVIVEPHTMHLISACFDFAVGMIRVTEMTLALMQGVIARDDVHNNDVMITRLLQTICLTIARLTDTKGCFRIFLDKQMPLAETIQSFPILTALYGVLLTLFKKEIQNSIKREPTKLIKILYKECKDHVDALENVINAESDFRLVNNPIYVNDITKNDEKLLIQFIKVIQFHEDALISKMSAVASNEDEQICIICYSNMKDVYFEPCRHQSCLLCVKQQLLESKNCFFCKTPIYEIRRRVNDEIVVKLNVASTVDIVNNNN